MDDHAITVLYPMDKSRAKDLGRYKFNQRKPKNLNIFIPTAVEF